MPLTGRRRFLLTSHSAADRGEVEVRPEAEVQHTPARDTAKRVPWHRGLMLAAAALIFPSKAGGIKAETHRHKKTVEIRRARRRTRVRNGLQKASRRVNRICRASQGWK